VRQNGLASDAADRNVQRANRRADRARFGPARVGEIALARAILVARHAVVVLAEIGRRMAEVDHVAAVRAARRASAGPASGGVDRLPSGALSRCG
jgi:hypothetical protein